MTLKKSLSASQYNKLKADLQQILQAVRQQEDQATSTATVEGYWKLGERIAEEKLSAGASYHNSILRDLAEDLNINARSLQQTVRLHALYPKPPVIPSLRWSHIRLLVTLSDDRERAFYEELAAAEHWSARKLSDSIRANRYLEARHTKNKKSVKLTRPTDADYLYTVEVRRVIDADTILVDLDLGFEVLKRQRMRLARVDALERGTTQGELARRYVQAELANAQRVIIKSNKSDIHGRYIAHIFYTERNLSIHATYTHGQYLNQKLLNHGYARAH